MNVVYGREDRLESVTAELAVKYKALNTLMLKDLLFHPHSAEKAGT